MQELNPSDVVVEQLPLHTERLLERAGISSVNLTTLEDRYPSRCVVKAAELIVEVPGTHHAVARAMTAVVQPFHSKTQR